MNKIIKAQSKAIIATIERANREHKAATDQTLQVRELVQASLTHAIKCGQALLKVKKGCKHGEWGAMFGGANEELEGAENSLFAFDVSWGNRYMKAAKFPTQARIASESEESFSLDRTYKALSGATEEAEKEAKNRPHILNNSGNDEWFTPADIIEAARLTMGGIDLDPASNAVANALVKAELYYSADDDGLTKKWTGRVWMNPPYSSKLVPLFCAKLADEVVAGRTQQAVVIVNNATETKWFADLVSVASAICFSSRRVRFLTPEMEVAGSPNQGQAIVYVGNDPDVFVENFAYMGWGVIL